jgi:uncharacterized Fe-S center protein
MANVYFKKINSNTSTKEIQEITKNLLKKIIKDEKITLEKSIPLKVHFGEKGNTTFIKPNNYEGIIDFLKSNNIESKFMETLVVYGGERNRKESHIAVAKEHGFIQLPIEIADGDHGEKYSEIKIDKKHFRTCKIGSEFNNYNQFIVLSHFKGHTLAGFGGAIKQLSMGFAAKGGKLAMHMGIKPKVIKNKCIKCGLCKKSCNENAITINNKSAIINYEKCVGCGGCVAVCPKKAITVITLKGIINMLFKGNEFKEKLVEYAYAAQLNKKNIYINFLMNITKSCDCVGKPMKSIIPDIGILISSDPVSIDKACYDLVEKNGKKFKGFEQFNYAEKIGLGSTNYNLIRL